MNELSVFIDESGDFGEYDFHSPYYIVSMVFHDQKFDISVQLEELDKKLTEIGFENHCVHAGPIIRGEYEYREVNAETRRKILKTLMAFARNTPFQYACFFVEKKHIRDEIELTGKLSKEIAAFIKSHYSYFLGYDTCKIYYDNGQVELTKILSSIFNVMLNGIEFRRVYAADYRLFQLADLICTLKLAKLKMESNSLSKSEIHFFGDIRTLKKNYLKPLEIRMLA